MSRNYNKIIQEKRLNSETQNKEREIIKITCTKKQKQMSNPDSTKNLKYGPGALVGNFVF